MRDGDSRQASREIRVDAVASPPEFNGNIDGR